MRALPRRASPNSAEPFTASTFHRAGTEKVTGSSQGVPFPPTVVPAAAAATSSCQGGPGVTGEAVALGEADGEAPAEGDSSLPSAQPPVSPTVSAASTATRVRRSMVSIPR